MTRCWAGAIGVTARQCHPRHAAELHLTSGALPSAGCAPGSALGLERVSVKDRRKPGDLGRVIVDFRVRNANLVLPFLEGPSDIAMHLRSAVSFTAFDGTGCSEVTPSCYLRRDGETIKCSWG
jgi:hypothetical protein